MSRLHCLLVFLSLVMLASCAQIGIPIKGGVMQAASVAITSGCLPDQEQNIASVGLTATATGGTPAYTWSNTGTLPTGITRSGATFSGTPTTPGTYNYTYTATDSLSVVSPPKVCVTVISATATIPSPWISDTIGTPQTVGSCAYSAGVWTIIGSGIDFGAASEGRRCYLNVSVDTYVIAQFTSCTTSGTEGQVCKLRVSISTAVDSPFVSCGTTTYGGVTYVFSAVRTTTGGSVTINVAAGTHAWYRITTVGTSVGCDYGDDGTNWTSMVTQVIALSGTFQIGMSAHQVYPATSTIVAANVTTGAWVPPAPDPTDFGGYRPTYQGFGVNATGGRTGTVLRVTNLNDSGAGSLRTALTTSGCRFVVFETSGTIALSSVINITSPCLTVAGQTAPSPGINITGRTININTHDVVFQHLRLRVNNICTGDGEGGAIRFGLPPDGTAAFNIVLDHLSISFGAGTDVAFIAGAQDIAILDTIIAQGVYKGACGQSGMILFGTVNGTATVSRNFFAHLVNRQPWIGSGFRAIHTNNLVYNSYNDNVANGGTDGAVAINAPGINGYPDAIIELASIGNIFLAGPDTGASAVPYNFWMTAASLPSFIYLSDNSGMHMTTADQWGTGVAHCLVANGCPGGVSTNANVQTLTVPSWFTPFNIVPIVNSGNAIRDYVLSHAGARPLDRDAVDTRLRSEALAGTGFNIFDPQTIAAVGGQPTIAVNSQAYTTPANPNNPGTCGTTTSGTVRTIIECDLLTKALALEP